MKSKLLYLILLPLIFGCYGSSILMVNESRQRIDNMYLKYEDPLSSCYNDKIDRIYSKDSLFVKYSYEKNPMDIMYLFKNDTCFYQQINLYCSPCAEEMLKDMIWDKRYKFKEIDGTNYISRKQKNIIMRLGSSIENDSLCSDIKVIMLDP